MAIVDAGGISAAQYTLNISQPTISSHLASLEARLGYVLCDRGRSGFKLTPKGERFAEIGHKLLQAVDNISAEAREIDRKLVGVLRLGLIGHMPISENAWIGRAIANFRRRDEAVQISIVMRPPGAIEEQLLSGQIHIAIGYFRHRVPTLEYSPLFLEKHAAYCGREHPLFPSAGSLTPNDLAGQDWAWRSYPILEAPPLPPQSKVSATADNMEAILVLILSGRHLGYLPTHFAAPYVKSGELAPVVPESCRYDVAFNVATKQRSQQSEIVRAFLKDVREAHSAAPKN